MKVREKSPREPVEQECVFTVRVALAPPEVGTFDVGEKEKVASEGKPSTVSRSAGIVPVEPVTSVRVTMYVVVVPRRTVEPGVTVIVKSYELTATLPLLADKSGSPV